MTVDKLVDDAMDFYMYGTMMQYVGHWIKIQKAYYVLAQPVATITINAKN